MVVSKGHGGMKKAVLVALGMTALLAPLAMKLSAQKGRKPSTCITKAEVDAVNATPGVDRTIRVVDIGNEHYSVGIIHRGATGAAARGAAAGGGAAAAQPAVAQRAAVARRAAVVVAPRFHAASGRARHLQPAGQAASRTTS